MKKVIISLLALMLCVCMLFVGCKNKDDADTTTTTENTTAATEAVATTAEPTSEVSTEESTEETSAESTTVTVPVTNKQPVKVTEPKVETNKKIDSYAWNGDGTYKCGTGDGYLVPGEYYIVRTGSAKCTVSLTNGQGYGIGREIENDTLATLKNGYTITVSGGKIIHASKAHPGADHNGIYGPGMYKVGRDIPAGEYIARKSASAPYAAGLSFYKSTDYFDLKTFDFRTVDNQIYITLEAGEYVEVAQGNLRPTTNESIAKENSDGSYSSGMYKIGVDIPAGRYMLTPLTSNAMYIIYKDSLYNSDSVVTSGTGIKNTIEIKLEKGQYVEFTGCKINAAVGGLEPTSEETSSAVTE